MGMAPWIFAYYCSGHGYGHATRVSAFASHLLSIRGSEQPIVYIVSSAPKHVFAECITHGARYRYAEIDPVIIQPIAYQVDRQKSVEALKVFLSKKDEMLERERQWLSAIQARCVLSDAAFLGCLAAKVAGIPSILITNFTFDSVYSYLSTPLLDTPDSESQCLLSTDFGNLTSDKPIPPAELKPLVDQLFAGYRCADLLLRLPGCIPIPSFCVHPSLPSVDWIDLGTRRFHKEISAHLELDTSTCKLHPPIKLGQSFHVTKHSRHKRQVLSAPLLVRPISSKFSVYSTSGRSQFLSSLGIPIHLHENTKILVVSFGGQVFRRPSRPNSWNSTPVHSLSTSPKPTLKAPQKSPPSSGALQMRELNRMTNSTPIEISLRSSPHLSSVSNLVISRIGTNSHNSLDGSHPTQSSRLATASHIWIPGAPPASKPSLSPSQQSFPTIPQINTCMPTPQLTSQEEYFNQNISDVIDNDAASLLPDPSWIAVVCGVSKEQWAAQNSDDDSDLPERFFVAPRNVYMPDLTAICDVLLGKLGYGTVSECVDACTPFVYVSRPLFIEEHGLRLFLDGEGVGIELSRQSYEAGDWAAAVSAAWSKGKAMKTRKRNDMAAGIGIDRREQEGQALAREAISWVGRWWDEELGITVRKEGHLEGYQSY